MMLIKIVVEYIFVYVLSYVLLYVRSIWTDIYTDDMRGKEKRKRDARIWAAILLMVYVFGKWINK